MLCIYTSRGSSSAVPRASVRNRTTRQAHMAAAACSHTLPSACVHVVSLAAAVRPGGSRHRVAWLHAPRCYEFIAEALLSHACPHPLEMGLAMAFAPLPRVPYMGLTWALHGTSGNCVCVCVGGVLWHGPHSLHPPPPVFIIALGGHPTHSTLEVTIDQPLPLACLHYVRSMPASASLLLQRPALCSPSGWPRRVPLCAPCTCTGRAG